MMHYSNTMLWIVGKSMPDFRNSLDAAGIPYGVFWDARMLPRPKQAQRIIPLDFRDTDRVQQQLKALPGLNVSAIVVAGYETYVLPAAIIAEHYGVPGPSVAAARAASNKSLMRQKFRAFDPAISPDFAEISSWHDIKHFMATHNFPVMLKPASLMKSLLITKNTSQEELLSNFEKAAASIGQLYQKYHVSQKPKMIIEECLDGSMHTVAAFADNAGRPIIVPGIVDCITGQEAGFNDNFLFARLLPTKLPKAEQDKIYAVAARGIYALGLASCPAHVEIMLTTSGPKIIEIGARIGGYRLRMYKYGYGVDLQQLMLANVYGRPLDTTESAHRQVAALELFPDSEGAFAALTNEAAVRALPSLRHLSIKPAPGQLIGYASQGYKAAAVIILGNEDAAQFHKDLEFVRLQAKIKLT